MRQIERRRDNKVGQRGRLPAAPDRDGLRRLASASAPVGNPSRARVSLAAASCVTLLISAPRRGSYGAKC
jgi:hypothetical protein